MNSLNQIFKKNEKGILLFFLIMTCVRLFYFNAIFPFFNNVDEQSHFDLIIKYSKKTSIGLQDIYLDQESKRNIILFSSHEYLTPLTAAVQEKELPPIWIENEKNINFLIEKEMPFLESKVNHSIFSPPIYYRLTGIWYNLGKCLGIKHLYLLYWLKGFNLISFLSLTLLAYYFCKKFFFDNPEIRICILVLLSIFPNDVFYALSNDSLSPLFFLWSYILLLEIYLNPNKTILFYLYTGIIISASFLVKLANIPLLAIFGFLSFKIKKQHQANNFWKNTFIIFFSFITPVLLWMINNYITIGAFTGTTLKMKLLDWHVKPMEEIFSHPLFSLDGLTIFLSHLLRSFWRGEFVWFLKKISTPIMDSFYVISSTIFLVFSFYETFIRSQSTTTYSVIKKINYLILLMYILFLMVLSIIYDFGNCHYPSKEYPYFTSGRLMLGALIPFLLLYVDGMITCLNKLKIKINPVVFISFIAITILLSEIHNSKNVFKSRYNLFSYVSHQINGYRK